MARNPTEYKIKEGSQHLVNATEVKSDTTTISESLKVEDDDDIDFGTDEDFTLEYDSSNDRFRIFDAINNTDILLAEKNGPLKSGGVNLDANSNDIIDGVTTIWDAVAGEIPDTAMGSIDNATLTNSSVTASAGTGLSTNGDGTLNLGDTETYSISRVEDDTSPGFTTNITTSGFAEVQLVVSHSPDSDTATDLQMSRDGGASWTTIQSKPSGEATQTDTVTVPITDSDTLQFRDNSGTGASVSISNYNQREIA